jgi:GMP synthase (glutamine-hydrolysing)
MKDIALLRASYSNVSSRNFSRELPANICSIDIQSESFQPEEFNSATYDAIIISGSKASVLDQKEWIKQAEKVVTEAVEEHSTPTLGVCWGNQLLAQAFGGTVETKKKRELGFTTVNRTENEHPIFHGIEDKFTAFQSHTDYVTEIPPSARLLAENSEAKQAFTYQSAVGVQFHPEVDYRTATDLINKYKDKKTVPQEPDSSVESWALSRESSDVLRNFLNQVVF